METRFDEKSARLGYLFLNFLRGMETRQARTVLHAGAGFLNFLRGMETGLCPFRSLHRQGLPKLP